MKGRQPDDKDILITSSSSKEQTMIVRHSFNYDNDPIKNVHWSDMVMGIWRASNHPGGNVQDLRYMVRHSIEPVATKTSDIELHTLNAMAEVYARRGVDDFSQTVTLSARATDVIEQESFNLMAAQTHVSRVYSMLQDFHQELGNLRIDKLHLKPGSDRFQGTVPHIVIEFGRW